MDHENRRISSRQAVDKFRSFLVHYEEDVERHCGNIDLADLGFESIMAVMNGKRSRLAAVVDDSEDESSRADGSGRPDPKRLKT